MSVDRCYVCGGGVFIKDPSVDYDEFQVLELYSLGHSYRAIAKELGLGVWTVQKCVRKHGEIVNIRPNFCNGFKPGQKTWKKRRSRNGQAKTNND